MPLASHPASERSPTREPLARFGRGFLAFGLSLAVCASVTAQQTLRVPRDHATIQNAIDASAAGDTVVVSNGTYHERIRMKSGIVLRSEGDDAKGDIGIRRAELTIINGGNKNGTGPGVTMAAGSTLDGFTVSGVGLYDNQRWNRHHATQGNDQSYEHIGSWGEPGIAAIGVSCEIKHNIVHHNGSNGIAIRGKCSPHVFRNHCFRNMGGGIGSMDGSTALIEENVCYENFYAGIGHENASPTVLRNKCYENIRAGIGVSEGACPTIQSNHCFRNRRAGIGTRTGAATSPLIIDNDCYENLMAGIGTEKQATPVIRGNRCYRNQMAGIGSRTGAMPLIIGNECFENKLAGIAQDSNASTTLIANHCHHNETSGVGFAECEAGRSLMIGNRIDDNATVAVGVHAGWNVRLHGNELSRAKGMPPIVMVFQDAEATLIDNHIRGGGVAGVRVAGKLTATNNRLSGEAMRKSGPPNFAIWALSGSDVTIADNVMIRWRHALLASDASVKLSRNEIREFHQTAIVIRSPNPSAQLSGNSAYSSNPNDKVLQVTGGDADANDNRLITPDQPKPRPPRPN